MTVDAPDQQTADHASTARGQSRDRLAALRTSARAAYAATVHHHRLAAESVIAAGVILDEAREVCPAGDWTSWLRQSGLSKATACAVLDLHRVSLDPEAVVELGGVTLSSLWAAVAQLPGEDEVLAVALPGRLPDGPAPIAYVWPAPDAPGGFCAGLRDLSDPDERSLVTRKPLTHERDVWATVWHLLRHRHGQMAFQPIRDAGTVIEAFEAHRQSILKAGVHRVH